jgi:hypothetical protein
MIDSMGYTADGAVWMKLLMDINGTQSTGIMTITPEYARSLSRSLIEAADGAEASVKAGGTLQ